jgi:hypothetical protein
LIVAAVRKNKGRLPKPFAFRRSLHLNVGYGQSYSFYPLRETRGGLPSKCQRLSCRSKNREVFNTQFGIAQFGIRAAVAVRKARRRGSRFVPAID